MPTHGEILGEAFGDKVSLLMPNPRYAGSIEAQVRENTALWSSLRESCLDASARSECVVTSYAAELPADDVCDEVAVIIPTTVFSRGEPDRWHFLPDFFANVVFRPRPSVVFVPADDD